MAADYSDLATQLTFRDNDTDVVVSDVLDDAPLLRGGQGFPGMYTERVPGYQYKYNKKTANPVTGFRSANDGRDIDHTERSQVTATLTIADATFDMDVAVAKSNVRGVEYALQEEATDHMQSVLFKVEQQILGGTVWGDSAGFNGLADESDLNGASDAQVVNATGTTANTGSSAWLIKMGPRDCRLLLGDDGVFMFGERTIIQKAGTTSGTFYPAYYQPLTGWTGFARGSTYSVVRIANLTEDSGKGLTDDLVADAIEKMPMRQRNGGGLVLVMSRRSQKQLQASRTATNPTGAPAPFPESSHNVPIVVTDAQIDTEALLA